MKLPTWRSQVYFYLREPGILMRGGKGGGKSGVAYKYLGRREAWRTGWGLIRAAVRPDPRWRW